MQLAHGSPSEGVADRLAKRASETLGERRENRGDRARSACFLCDATPRAITAVLSPMPVRASHRSRGFEGWLKHIISRRLDEARRPAFLHPLSIVSLDLGASAPQVKGIRAVAGAPPTPYPRWSSHKNTPTSSSVFTDSG